ncbi:hypothetical protein ACFQ7F_41580, partial [Streptomyces sp. NPDC056486]|uniref:hypothetical protein n=1 Tax=Streptomyces sp. NPDC056486 TaxID=3345835 RepID=UPI00369ECA1D
MSRQANQQPTPTTNMTPTQQKQSRKGRASGPSINHQQNNPDFSSEKSNAKPRAASAARHKPKTNLSSDKFRGVKFRQK